MKKYESAVNFLLSQADIAIKYRVIDEICNDKNSVEHFKLKNELINSERAKRLIEYLVSRKEYHGATLYAVENSLNMLVDMGFVYGNGFDDFDKAVEEIVEELKNKPIDSKHVLRYLPYIVVVPFLLRAGVRQEWLIEFVKERIDIIYSFVKQKDYNIYDETIAYKRIPPNFKNRPIIYPKLYEDGQIKLPLEYDIYGFAALVHELPNEYKDRVDEIISYIMDSRFQTIEDGYGVLSDRKNYWALGWDSKPTNLEKEYGCNPLLLKMELLSSFPEARNSRWFSQALNVTEKYVDANGIYHYPKKYLTEKDSCWILGNHMGLGENRRRKEALAIEGTFRTLNILKNLDKLKKIELTK